MDRPDLPKGYGGWQSIDGTPQETSDSKVPFSEEGWERDLSIVSRSHVKQKRGKKIGASILHEFRVWNRMK